MSEQYNPHAYQEKGIKLLVSKACSGLFLKPGLGKTSITLAAIKILLAKGLVRRVLVVGPLRVIGIAWPDEMAKWTDFNDLSYTMIHGPEKVAAVKEKTDIHFVNYEGLIKLIKQVKDLSRFPYDMIVFDESSRMKSYRSKRFKEVQPILGKFSRRVILTGTPAPNGMMDLFSQVYCMDRGMALGQYITHFRNKFFYTDPFVPNVYHLKPGAKDEIYSKLQDKILHLSAKDYVQMPQLIETNIYVDLPESVRPQYNTMERDLFTQIEHKKITAANAAVASGKLRQIANGFLYDDGAVSFLHDAKVEAFKDLIEDLDGKPVLVFYEYTEDYNRLNKILPGAHIGGILNDAQRKVIEDWNKGLLSIVYAHPASAGHGLNLQQGGYNVIWYGPTWNAEYWEQAIDRLYRQGQLRDVFVYYILTRRTIDDAIMIRLKEKNDLQNSLLTALSKYWAGITLSHVSLQ